MTNNSVPSLKIHCVQLPDVRVFYHFDNSIEESQHEQFAGRGKKVKELSLNITAGVDQSKRVRHNTAVAVTDGSASLLDLMTAAATVVVVLIACHCSL
ncbi:hypothetical protein EXN66_Car013704 [Channa argus]|uniref:Uncharacterized protein n=1 Tax=Channa argus TaxID=215402 RepID=A0A6G1Q6P6_CHAAH|nr:hypothetical protein EXN66_Car013704 [Channa argus]